MKDLHRCVFEFDLGAFDGEKFAKKVTDGSGRCRVGVGRLRNVGGCVETNGWSCTAIRRCLVDRRRHDTGSQAERVKLGLHGGDASEVRLHGFGSDPGDLSGGGFGFEFRLGGDDVGDAIGRSGSAFNGRLNFGHKTSVFGTFVEKTSPLDENLSSAKGAFGVGIRHDDEG